VAMRELAYFSIRESFIKIQESYIELIQLLWISSPSFCIT
jgi:hypothetical protein